MAVVNPHGVPWQPWLGERQAGAGAYLSLRCGRAELTELRLAPTSAPSGAAAFARDERARLARAGALLLLLLATDSAGADDMGAGDSALRAFGAQLQAAVDEVRVAPGAHAGGSGGVGGRRGSGGR